MQLSPMLTSVGCISSMYTNWLIQTLFPIVTPRSRCNHGRKLNPPGATKAILPASLPRSRNVNGSYLSLSVFELVFETLHRCIAGQQNFS